MEGEFMSKTERLPEIIVFAGPNGSGKTTLTCMAKTVGVYISADDSVNVAFQMPRWSPLMWMRQLVVASLN